MLHSANLFLSRLSAKLTSFHTTELKDSKGERHGNDHYYGKNCPE